MHMADALLSPEVSGTMYALTGLATAYSVHKLRKEEDLKKKIPTMGVMGALVFATQMINFTIPGTGSSGHLCGGMLLTSILGPYAGFITMIGLLLIQCLFFADGGLLALGGNIWNMAFYGCFLGAIIWRFVMKNGVSKKKIVFSSIVGSIVSIQLGAFSVTIETLLSNVTSLPFGTFIMFMLPIHLAIGLVEGLITTFVLLFIYEAREELLWKPYNNNFEIENRFSYKKVIAILCIMFVVIAGGLSLIASSNPDGLEWSIEKVTGNTEIENNDNPSYEVSSEIQEKTSILPDYNFKESESNLGTSISGLVGCLTVIVFLGITGYLIKLTKKKETLINEQN